MSGKWVIAGLSALNAALLVSHWNIARNAQGILGDRATAQAQELLQKEAGHLSMERAQLSLQAGVLSELASTLRTLQSGGGAPPQAELPKTFTPPEDVQKMLERAGIAEKPDPLSISLLTDDEKQTLLETGRTLPELSLAPLRSVDLDALLADKTWNPQARELSPEERAQAQKLLKDHHYFSRIGIVERLKVMMEPALDRMRELGAYVDYDPMQGELPFDGRTIDHTEIFSKNKFRMFFFPQDQYPDLYHHRQVCEEQANKAFVDLYRLVAKG